MIADHGCTRSASRRLTSRRRTAIFVGHAHFDHMSDAATVGKQTRAPVIGAAFASDVLAGGGLPATQFKSVKGGEVMQYQGVTVEAALGHHNVIATQVPEGFLEKQATALEAASLQKPLTDVEKQQLDAIRARGSRDPKISDQGVINYLFTFGNRVPSAVRRQPGTDHGRAARAGAESARGRCGDVAVFRFRGGIPPLLALVKTFNPSTVFLGHHDAEGTMKWASNYPAALAIRERKSRRRGRWM
jgi:hypothetical protein